MKIDTATLKINDLTWTVKKVSPDSKYLNLEDGSAYGVTYIHSLTIYIQNSELSKDLYYRFLKHELTHAYIFSYHRSKAKWNEEDICELIETHADKIIEDARWLVKVLFGYTVE